MSVQTSENQSLRPSQKYAAAYRRSALGADSRRPPPFLRTRACSCSSVTEAFGGTIPLHMSFVAELVGFHQSTSGNGSNPRASNASTIRAWFW